MEAEAEKDVSPEEKQRLIDRWLRGRWLFISKKPEWKRGITHRRGRNTGKRIRLLAKKMYRREIAAKKRETGLSRVKHLIERHPSLNWK